jgi:Tfp pilus assembly protein PilX
MKVIMNRRQQHGAALVIGLMMMVALTLIGVTTMGMSSMELRMASNAQNKSNAFQAAEAGLEIGLGRTNAENITTAQPIAPPTLVNATAMINSTFVGLIAGRGDGFTSGVSCPGSSPERTRCAHFQVTSVGQHLQSNASSTQVQGFYVLAPQRRQ